jgi:hypothetical protein
MGLGHELRWVVNHRYIFTGYRHIWDIFNKYENFSSAYKYKPAFDR